jgi:hypothetical protein
MDPIRAVHLSRQFLGHDLLSVDNIQMGEEDQALSCGLVELNGVRLLDELPNNLTLVILDNQHLLGTDHLFNHDLPQV